MRDDTVVQEFINDLENGWKVIDSAWYEFSRRMEGRRDIGFYCGLIDAMQKLNLHTVEHLKSTMD